MTAEEQRSFNRQKPRAGPDQTGGGVEIQQQAPEDAANPTTALDMDVGVQRNNKSSRRRGPHAVTFLPRGEKVTEGGALESSRRDLQCVDRPKEFGDLRSSAALRHQLAFRQALQEVI